MTRVEDVNKQILEKLTHLESFLGPRHSYHSQLGAFPYPRFRHTIYDPTTPSRIVMNPGIPSSPHATVPESQTSPNLSDMEPPTQHTGPSQNMTSAPSPSDAPGPEAPPLRHANLNSPLPSSEIPKQTLLSVNVVLNANCDLKGEEKAGTLCQKLAKEAMFGPDVMRRCTPAGPKELPALPKTELFALKTVMFRQLPQFWHRPNEFEKKIWKEKCWVAIEQACKRLRR